jgi:RecA/RadA recombinase
VSKLRNKVKKEVGKKKADREGELVQIKDEDLLSTGYTPLNVALSGRVKGGYGKGLFVFVVGDSSTGKSFITQTCLAEAAARPEFDEHEFIFDNIERGSLFNTRKFFGRAVADRMVPPNGTREKPEYSATIEDLYYTLDDKLKSGKPFIYIVDSMDGLVPADDIDKFQEQKSAHRKGKQTSGSYGMAKAKANSSGLRMIVPELEKTGSILIVISQTRDNIGFGYETKTRSGGKALRFYAHVEFWMSVKEKIKKTVMGKPRHVGNVVVVDIKKNRLTGWEGKIDMVFLKQYGLDDVGGCIDYLVNEGYWKKGQGGINAEDFGVRMDREKLARHLQDEGLEHKLHLLVKKVFREIEEKSAPNRKPRYV